MSVAPKDLEYRFAELAELAPAQRPDALRELAAVQPTLARRVAVLLDAHDASAGHLDDVAAATALLPSPESMDLIGRELGGWHLQRELGRGGMGVVYAGTRQREGIQERAAVKLLAIPMFDTEAAQRFVREASVLARLDHPGICRLRDWGRSEQGWPYLVLDLVEGAPIDQAAADLSVDRRLELLARIAEAVGAAHRKLVVHLDLKPDNILLAAGDHPVLLDFGISRVLSDDHGQATVTLTRWLTPDYASPEQLRGEPASVAADIYALGAITYQLMTGARPFDLAGVSVTEALRRVERGPEPPDRVASGLPGDLSAVIGKAMHPEPARRYASADAFADDLRALQARRPVAARPDSAGYRLRKLLHRHPIAVPLSVLGVLAITALAASLATLAVDLRDQRDRAETEAARARSAVDLLLGSIQAADPTQERGAELTVSELLDSTSGRIDEELVDAPDIQFAALIQVADVRRSLGQHGLALPLYQRARQLRSGDDRNDEPALALTVGLAEALRGADQVEEAISVLDAAHARLGIDAHWSLHMASARARLAQSQLDPAEVHVRQALLALPPHDTGNQALLFQLQGFIDARRERHAEAILAFEHARSLIRDDPTQRALRATIQMEMADSLARLGEFDRAMTAMDEALASRESMYGQRHPATVEALLNKVYLLEHSGDWSGGLAVAEQAVALEAAMGDRPSRRLERLLAVSGTLHRSLGDSTTALAFHRRSLAMGQRLYPALHRSLANSHSLVGTALADLGDFEGTIEHYRQSWSIYDELAGSDLSRGRAIAAINLSSSYRSLGRLDDAIDWGARAVQEAERLLRPDDWTLANFRMIQARTLFQAGHAAEAEALALDVERVYQASSVPVRPNALRNNAQLLADIYASTGQMQRAKPYLAQLAALTSPDG